MGGSAEGTLCDERQHSPRASLLQSRTYELTFAELSVVKYWFWRDVVLLERELLANHMQSSARFNI